MGVLAAFLATHTQPHLASCMDLAALDAREACVQSENDIDSELLAHVAGKYYGPYYANMIRQAKISAQILAPPALLRRDPVSIDALRHVLADTQLWIVVRATWIHLLRLRRQHIRQHINALNERLAAVRDALQLTPAPVCRLEQLFVPQVSAQEIYYRRRADLLGAHATRSNNALCQFRNCNREWNRWALQRHLSLPLFHAKGWQAFFCDAHRHTIARRPRASYDVFCNTCGAMPPVFIIVELCGGDRYLPLCTDCRTTPYVRRQLAAYVKRHPPAVAGNGEEDSETECE